MVQRASATKPGPWAWAIAAGPALSLAVAVGGAVATSPGSTLSGPITIGWFAGAVFAFVAALMDVRWLGRRGDPAYPALTVICLLLSGWAYLLARAIKRRNGADWEVFAACAAATALVFAIVVPIATAAKTGSMIFNQTKAHSDIAAWFESKTGSSARVNCPVDPPMEPGTTFTCIATTSGGSTVPIAVMVQDNSGDVVWQLGN